MEREYTPPVEANLHKLLILTAFFIGGLLVANFIAGVKLVKLAGLVLPVGFLAYAVTFPVTDIVGEVYGPRVARYYVWAGLVAEVLMLVLVVVGKYFPPLAPEMQTLYEKAFMPALRVTIAGIVAYILSQTHDVWAFHTWKRITHGRHLWIRNNASTIVSQLIDTTTFITFAFYGVVPTAVLLKMILGQWLWKVAVALGDTPFVYLGVWWLKRGAAEVRQPVVAVARG